MNNHAMLLEEPRRTALLAYYLGQLVPADSHPSPSQIVASEDVYEYLLIDPLVTANVDTSRVAQAIASLQQHINAIFNGMEPGFERVCDLDHRQAQQRLWREAMSQYSLWAGYQMLADYPENYLDPTLRLGKTESFKAFENELAQARLSTDTVQTAVGNYLSRFEEVSNLGFVCCYIDGLDFRKADYYFVGKQNVAPFAYYWRKAAIDLDDDSTRVLPSAWSEWRKIEAAVGERTTHVRAAVVDGRLHLVWLDEVREVKEAQSAEIAADPPTSIYRLNVSYRQHDDRWSPAVCLHEAEMASPQRLEESSYVLAATVDSQELDQRRLSVALCRRNDPSLTADAFLMVFDSQWRAVNLKGIESGLMKSFAAMIGDAPGRAQYPLGAVKNDGVSSWVESVVWDRDGANYPGPLSPYLEMEVVKSQAGLTAFGICNQPWYVSTDQSASPQPLRTNLGVWQYDPRSQYSLVLNGAARTPASGLPWPLAEGPAFFGKHDKEIALGYNQFKVNLIQRSDQVPELVTNGQGGQFLDLRPLGLPKLKYVRLNTLFAGELARHAERSLEAALGWEAQHSLEGPEPAGGNQASVPVDFNGANGRYFWEVFFHVPHLVAWRLHHEFDYAGAERWLNCLFNPQVRVAPLHPPPDQVDWLPYWTCRPLGFADDPVRDTAGPVDPDAIAYGAPSHYRKAIFMLYLDNLIAWGDALYRQVTRDTLNEAKLLYTRALSLLGPLSKGRSISQWAPVPLEQAAAEDATLFIAAESKVARLASLEVPVRAEGQPWLRLIDAPWFRLPVNTRLLDLWDQLDLRLYNLRHNLTLDGKPMQLALYEAPANPLDLLRAQLAGSSASARRLGSMSITPPYRFSAMLLRAQTAVATLMRFGEQVRNHLEGGERAQREALEQAHVLELSTFMEALETQAIEQATALRDGLLIRQTALDARIDYYAKQIARDVSQLEQQADNNSKAASELGVVALEMMELGHLASFAPNTMTMVSPLPPVFVPGGWNWAGPFLGISSGMDALGAIRAQNAQTRLLADSRARRRDEWHFLQEQAELERGTLARQIEQQDVVIRAARTRLVLAGTASTQAQAHYAFIVNRATGRALYQWLLSQISTLYFQAYDAVLSLCLATEACWQYEIGDGETRFVPVDVWTDNRHGLNAGEALQLGLLRMESAFIARHERRLELVKTVSLRRLLADFESEDGQVGWDALLASVRATGKVEFALKPPLFDRDYPGHYLRQLVRVSVSLPGVLGPYEDARALLSQQSSHYLVKPDLGGIRSLYALAQEPVEGASDTRYVVSNRRGNQQIGISGDNDDAGLHLPVIDDARYLPFEGTGAISNWILSFPRPGSARQQALFDGLQDIIVHVRYRAVDGGKTFAEQVKALKPDSERRQARVSNDRTTVLPLG